MSRGPNFVTTFSKDDSRVTSALSSGLAALKRRRRCSWRSTFTRAPPVYHVRLHRAKILDGAGSIAS